MICNKNIPSDCRGRMRAIHDTIDLLSGKWKVAIINSLCGGTKRFMDMQREVEGIGPKMLSKELQELEINGLIQRTVSSTKPLTIVYQLTEYGYTLQPVMREMAAWGIEHRRRIMQFTT